MQMNLRNKIFTGILVVLLLAILGYRFLMPKDAIRKVNPDIIMAVGGDPRMLLCKGPKDGLNAEPSALAALGLETPLELKDKDKAIYRVSILRKTGNSYFITFSTPKQGPAGIFVAGKYGTIAGADAKTIISTEKPTSFQNAKDLVELFKNSPIWGDEKPTMRPKRNTSEASAVIEIKTPSINRCIATRYDDEKIRPLIREFMLRVPALVTEFSVDDFAPKEDEIFGKEYAPGKKK